MTAELPATPTTGRSGATSRTTQRCSDAARLRGDPLPATAPPAARLLLVEVAGPWGSAGLAATRLPPDITRPLAAALDAAGVRVQLIRRPERSTPGLRSGAAVPAEGYRWALADVEAGVVRWGRWHDPEDLPQIDAHARLNVRRDAPTGPQRLVLVCTHAKRDVCCAVRGRPVAAAVAAAGLDRDVWETSHLGGDRFAANLLLLPEGEVFGGLDGDTAVDVVRRMDAGRLTLASHRGRVGQRPAVQAAIHAAAAILDDDQLGAVRLEGAPRRDGDDWLLTVRHAGRRYALRLAESWAAPERLTCAALEAKPARRFTVVEMVDEEGERRAG